MQLLILSAIVAITFAARLPDGQITVKVPARQDQARRPSQSYQHIEINVFLNGGGKPVKTKSAVHVKSVGVRCGNECPNTTAQVCEELQGYLELCDNDEFFCRDFEGDQSEFTDRCVALGCEFVVGTCKDE